MGKAYPHKKYNIDRGVNVSKQHSILKYADTDNPDCNVLLGGT